MKTLLTVGGVLLSLGVTWGLFNGRMVRAEEKLSEQTELVTGLFTEQQQDNIAQVRLADRVEGIDKKVDKIDGQQATMAVEQTKMSRELFEQRTMLMSILEEVKKP